MNPGFYGFPKNTPFVPTSRVINTTAPLTGGGDLMADRTIAISDATATTRGAVPTPPNDTTKFYRGDSAWAVPPKYAVQFLLMGA